MTLGFRVRGLGSSLLSYSLAVWGPFFAFKVEGSGPRDPSWLQGC